MVNRAKPLEAGTRSRTAPPSLCHEGASVARPGGVEALVVPDERREHVGVAAVARLSRVEIRADENHIRERLKVPRPDSEADFAVFMDIRDRQEPIETPHLVLWSDEMTLEDMVEAIHTYSLQTAP